MQRLAGKVAIVTGAGSGIGQEIAKRLGCEGAKVLVDCVSDRAGARETLRAIEEADGEGEIALADVKHIGDVSNLVELAWNWFGAADILVTSAGIEKRSDFWDTTEADYYRVMAVNLRGPFFLTQAFVRRLREAGKPGRIVNISSVHDDMAFPGFVTYSCSKGGLRMLMRDLAVELGPMGITVNSVASGAIATRMNRALLNDKPKLNALLENIPLRRLGTAADVAGLVVFLASDEGSYVTGATFVVDGGLMRSYHEQ